MNLKSWSWVRIIRLVIGGSFVGQAIDAKEWILLPIGLFLLYQGLINVGCSSCEITSDQLGSK